MGNNHTKYQTSFTGWQKIQLQEGDIQIYQNSQIHQIAQKRSITIDPHHELQQELKIYHLRQYNNDALVRSFGAQQVPNKANQQGICSGHKKIQVLTQKMPYRLSDLPQLTFPQALLFLRESLRAYSRVFKSYGPIHVTKRLIGINDFGQVKCWVNQNWALNHPSNELPTLQSTKLQSFSSRQTQFGTVSEVYDARYRDETEMVHNIVSVIQEKCEEGQYPQAFGEEVQQHSGSFKRLSSYVEDFIRVNELFIPPKINYETVMVSKYQGRLAQQDQHSAQEILKSQINIAQSIGDLGLRKNQNIATNENFGGVNIGYHGSGHQQSFTNYNFYGKNKKTQISGAQTTEGGYTVAKTITEHGNTLGSQNSTINTYTALNQPSSYYTSTYNWPQGTSSILGTKNASNTTTLPQQKIQSIYKLPQNQNSQVSFLYSATNPSSYGYNTGAKSINSGYELRKQSQNFGTYNSALITGLVGNKSYSDYSSLGNLKDNTITSLDNKFGLAQTNTFVASQKIDNTLGPYQNLGQFTANQDHKNQLQTFSSFTANKFSDQDYNKNLNQAADNNRFGTHEYSATKSYKFGGQNTYEQFTSGSGQNGSVFSFDGKDDLKRKFSQYSTTGYSNTLNTYNKNPQANLDGVPVQGKASETIGIMSSFLKMQEQFVPHQSYQKSKFSSVFNNKLSRNSSQTKPINRA